MTPQERKVFELALEALEKIATVNAMDYEYQAWAREALAQPEDKKCENCGEFGECCQDAQPDQDEVDIRSRLYQRIHELETQLAQSEQEYGVVAGVGKGVEIPAGVKYYYIEPKLPPQHKE